MSDDAIRRISNSSSEKFTKNPNLRVIASENGRRVIEQLRESGKAYKMPSGSHHTPEHKQYMSDLMRGRTEIVEIKGWVKDVESFDAKCFAGELYCNGRGYVYRVLYKKEIISEWC